MVRGTGSQYSITRALKRKQPALPREMGNIPDWTLRHREQFTKCIWKDQGNSHQTQHVGKILRVQMWSAGGWASCSWLEPWSRGRVAQGSMRSSMQTVEDLEALSGLELYPVGLREMWQGFEKGCGFEMISFAEKKACLTSTATPAYPFFPSPVDFRLSRHLFLPIPL